MTPFPGAETVLRSALAARTFSAFAAEIGNTDGPVWTVAGGTLGFETHTAVDATTIFDLASLTKVIATTTIALMLAQNGAVDVDARVASALPEWSAADRSNLTFRDLLEHSSGLPAHREYFRQLIGIEAFVAAIAVEPLEYAPRTRALYSDLGFIVLGAALEQAGRARLNQQFNQWKVAAGIAEPIAFLPPTDWKPRTAITEYDAWRGRRLQGEVHDQNAAALGGVAAHAGLFGTVGAVGAAARWWMRVLGTAAGRRFARRSAVPGSSRALGWDTMLPTSSCGSLMSPRAIGHTGFTGTSLWIDPARERYYVLLTNRVHAAGSADAIQQVRRDFHDQANATRT
jgi:CubicO group peptidase (beta-lactamase class C family)